MYSKIGWLEILVAKALKGSTEIEARAERHSLSLSPKSQPGSKLENTRKRPVIVLHETRDTAIAKNSQIQVWLESDLSLKLL